MSITIAFASQLPRDIRALAIPVAAGAIAPDRLPLSGAGATLLVQSAAAQRFEGEAGGVAETFVAEDGAARRILLAGIGGDADGAALEKAGGALVARLLTSGEERLAIDVSRLGTSAAGAAHIAFGALLRSWRHDIYRTTLKAKAKPSLREVVIVGAPAGAEAAWARLAAIADGVFLARELVTEPANILYPESFVDRVTKSLDGLGVEIDVLDPAEMAKLGMGALLGVAQGSRKPARLLCMRWKGAEGDPVALVGKGVTFDTGGISIKPAAGMEDMKWDMGGAAAVAGAMKALAGRKAKAHVIGVCGLVENMPDGDAQRPGDVVKTMSGQTVEVINTDAEGRLVLCDAITWVQRTHGVKTIVDLATLTGAMIVSLGHEYGGIFANDEALAGSLLAASTATGDKLWRMPLGDAYDKLINSDIADMKNIGPRMGGSITAAQFIKRFVEEGTKWAHLDIAGMVWASKPSPLWDKGATGYGVRLLDRFVSDTLEGMRGDVGGMQVDFYQLSSTPIERVLPRIAERVLEGGARLLIVTGDDAQAELLDRVLWTYTPESFLPHARAGTGGEADQPVLIAGNCAATNGARNVALADGAWRDEALGFERAFQLFDDGTLKPARAAWRTLKGRAGVEPRYWRQEEGKWRNVG